LVKKLQSILKISDKTEMIYATNYYNGGLNSVFEMLLDRLKIF